MITPRTPPGVLELLPAEQIAFNRMLDVIRANFERFGFLPISTPSYELTDVLLTKTGGETERQVYFVQSTGALQRSAEESGAATVPDLALRFDLTVPLARYVAEHEHQLTFPFRRYQIQPVFRGERPQRGRFREFLQCDIDIIGKDDLSIRHDAECPAVVHAVFSELAIGPFTLHLNNRRLLRGVLNALDVAEPERQAAVLREVDKLDKRGADWVAARLVEGDLGMGTEQSARLLAVVQTRSTSHQDALDRLAQVEAEFGRPGEADDLARGVQELREVVELLRALGVPESDYLVNFAIARGLDYYTGTVYETVLDEHPGIGSICSGGRYDDLAGQYTKSRLPGVGLSIGLSRLFWQLRDAGVVSAAESTIQVLVPHLGDEHVGAALAVATDLRRGGINVESVLDASKLAKQMKYADRAGIRFVALVGAAEVEAGTVTVRDLRRQDQFTVARDELVRALRVELAQPLV